MSVLDQARATQLANIEKKTGKSLVELRALVAGCGRTKHGEIRDWLKAELGLGHGDANSLTHIALESDGQSAAEAKQASPDAVLDEIYSGKKAHQRPIHDALMALIEPLGAFEIAPKKGYVSLRRKKQFAMLGPKTNERFELGLNLKGVVAGERAKAMPPGGMCTHVVALTEAAQVDAEVEGLLRQAFDQAG